MTFKKVEFTRVFAICCVAFTIIFSLLLTSENRGSAANVDYDAKISELEKKAEEIKKKNEQREAEINRYKNDASQADYYKKLASEAVQGIYDQIEANEELIHAKQDSIDQKLIEINNLDSGIRETEIKIADLKLSIERKEAENIQNLERFGQIVKAMYMTENVDPLSLLAGSTDFFDLIMRTEIINSVGEQNIEFMNGLLNDIDVLEKMILECEDDEQRLRNAKSIRENEKLIYENEMAELERVKRGLELEMAEAESTLYKYSNDYAETQNKIENLRQSINISKEQEEELNREIAAFIEEKQRQAAGQPAYSTDGFRWPLDSKFQYISCHFGYDSWRGGNHYGIDVGNAGINGANIYAAQSGKVIRSLSGDSSTWGGGFGNYIIIDHGDGISTTYAHCQPWSIKFKEGDTVNKGDVIALVGSTGWATGPHLHFEVRINGTAVNPLNYSYE